MASKTGPQEGSAEISFRGILGAWVGLGAKMAPRSPQDPPRPLPRLIFMDFGPQLADFLLFFYYFFNFLMFLFIFFKYVFEVFGASCLVD